jgi:hypothetical protein
MKSQHMPFLCVLCASFTYHNIFKVNLHCSMYQYLIPFLWLNNIPLYRYYILFTHLFDD